LTQLTVQDEEMMKRMQAQGGAWRLIHTIFRNFKILLITLSVVISHTIVISKLQLIQVVYVNSNISYLMLD
jgi:hypothetical protein